MKSIFLIGLFMALPTFAQSSTPANVSEVDCLGEIESLELGDEQLDELSKKCQKEADELFKVATAKQDQALITKSAALRKSATIAKTLRQKRASEIDAKKNQELRNVQKNK